MMLSIRGKIVGLLLQDMDFMVKTSMTTEREIEDARSIQDAGASGKRKESQSSSSSGKKPKASSSRGFQSRGHQGQGQARAPSQAGRTVYYFCHQPGHMKRDCPRGKDPKISGQRSPSHQWDRREHSLFLHPLVRVRGTNISPRVLYEHLLLHRQSREAKAWVGAEDRAHRPGHQGFKDVSTLSHHRLGQQINQLYKVCFCYLAYGQGYYLILVHCIHSSMHHVCESWS